jgi:flagella basal body P-ring formation protein FlgA
MNKLQIKSLLMVVSMSALAGVTANSSATDVKLRERVTPKSSVVRLGDVAEIVTADRQLARKLAVVPLMPSPAPGTERFLQKREVADMIAASGVDLAEIRFDGATRVAVAGRSAAQPAVVQVAAFEEAAAPVNNPTSQSNGKNSEPTNLHAAVLAGEKPASPAQLSDEELAAAKSKLEQIVASFVQSRGGKVGRIELNVASRQLSQLASATSLPTCEGGSEPWTGRQALTLSFNTANGVARVPVTADIAEPAAPVVVAVRPVGRGSIVTAADIEVRMLEPTTKTTGKRAVFDSIERMIGMEVRQALREGEVVFADQLQSPIVIKRGELVTISSQTSGIRVRTSARAMQDGSTGDLIQVESLESKQQFNVRVTGLREAAILAVARPSDPPSTEHAQAARRMPPHK